MGPLNFNRNRGLQFQYSHVDGRTPPTPPTQRSRSSAPPPTQRGASERGSTTASEDESSPRPHAGARADPRTTEGRAAAADARNGSGPGGHGARAPADARPPDGGGGDPAPASGLAAQGGSRPLTDKRARGRAHAGDRTDAPPRPTASARAAREHRDG